MITGHHVIWLAFSPLPLPLAFGSGSGPSSGMSWYSCSMDLSYREFPYLPLLASYMTAAKWNPKAWTQQKCQDTCDNLSHVSWHFCCVHALDLLKGLKNKRQIKTYTMESPDDGFSPLGTEIKTKIDLNKPKTLQECTAASPKFLHQHLGQLEDSITKVFHEALSGANLQPEPHRRRPNPAGGPNSRSSWHSSLSTRWCALDSRKEKHPQPNFEGWHVSGMRQTVTGHCVTVITLFAACQTHAILQNSAVDASLFFSDFI